MPSNYLSQDHRANSVARSRAAGPRWRLPAEALLANGTRRPGGMLVLAIFFIFLATSLATLIMAGSAQLIRTTSHEHEAILLRQLTDSGCAWALAQSPPRTAPVVLNGVGLLPEGFSGEVQVSFDPQIRDILVVTAVLKRPARELSQATRFRLPP